MDETGLIRILSGERRGPAATFSRFLLAGLSAPYAGAMSIRNAAYDCGWLATHPALAPVISVGNLTTGGTGKTPFTAYLARRLQEGGLRPGLLSRGYRALNDAENDEKLVLDRLCPGVVQVQQPDRVAGAQRAVRELGCDVLLLDDGFQHRRLRRDLEIVLIDALRPWGFGHLLPRGLLREPLASLKRADLIVLTRAELVSPEQRHLLRETLQQAAPTVPVAEVAFRPGRLLNATGGTATLESVAGRRCLAFCGIGNPDGFAATLRSAGVVAELQAFPDHYHYQAADWNRLRQRARDQDAQVLVTTLKDLVKLPAAWFVDLPVYAVDQTVDLLSGSAELDRLLQPFARPANRAA